MRHHFVPQFLLRSWAETTPDQRVEAFRLDLYKAGDLRVKSDRRAPKHTGYESDLYALTRDQVGGFSKHALETEFLKHVDNDAAAVLAKLKATGLLSLSPQDREDWTRFLITLRLRNPETIEQHRLDSANELRKNLDENPGEYEELAGEGDPPTLSEWAEKAFPGLIENFGMTFLHEVMDDPKIGTHILRMKWWLWDFSKGRHDLLLADRPCIFTRGLSDNNLIIALPIGPRQAFFATQPGNEHAAQSMRRQNPKRLAGMLNDSTMNNARARLYARDRTAERYILNRVRLIRSP